MEQKVKKTDVS